MRGAGRRRVRRPPGHRRGADVVGDRLGPHRLLTRPQWTRQLRRVWCPAVTRSWKDVAVGLGRIAVREAPKLLRQLQSRRSGPAPAPAPGRAPSSSPAQPARTRTAPPSGRHLEYAPQPDGQADPGEIVWTWVRYEDD